MKESKNYLIIVGVFVLLLVVGTLFSTGLFNQFLSLLTGKAQDAQFDLNITIQNTPPVIPFVSTISGATADPTEAGVKEIEFYFIANDSDGYDNIDNSTAVANFTNQTTGAPIRINSTCEAFQQVDTQRANFSCRIGMQYWDSNGTWNITVAVDDSSAATAQNVSTSFTYNALTAIPAVSPNLITWVGITSGGIDQKANNDPIEVNNTGNTRNTVRVNATNLVGAANPSYALYGGNFSVTQDDTCNTVNMTEADYANVTSAILPPGNLTLGGGVAQEDLYVCLNIVGTLTSQEYSTNNINSKGPWTILAVAPGS